jgi:hypothetical protein
MDRNQEFKNIFYLQLSERLAKKLFIHTSAAQQRRMQYWWTRKRCSDNLLTIEAFIICYCAVVEKKMIELTFYTWTLKLLT